MVRPQAAGGRHSSFAPTPIDPPARGSLPLISQILQEGACPPPAFPAARGELPVAPPPRARAPQRTKVKLTSPTKHDETTEDDDVRVYVEPPDTGLGSFDLGSVPASVTPPRTWRKAAWFATASSGGVVVALLFAGSALVGKPTPTAAGDAWIPGLGGGLSTIEGERVVPGPSDFTGTSTVTDGRHTARDPRTSSDPVGRPDSMRAPVSTSVGSTVDTVIIPTDGTSTSAGSSRPRPTTTTPIPVKPTPTPAPFDADPPRFQFGQGDPQTLAKDSQAYLDSVTQDPQAAYAMTTGQLQQEGPQGLKKKYADVAYFQVERIHVHQYDGQTVCTVKLVRKNGTQTTEQRTITFQGGKIASDNG